MTWQSRARRRRILIESLWQVPAASMLAALLLAPLVRWVDEQTRWTLLGFGPDSARAVVGALSASLLTFIVFALSTLLLLAQMASAQFTPRIIVRVFEHPFTKATLGALAFAWVYSLAALGRVDDRVPQLSIALASLLSLASVCLFLLLVQRVIKAMRPVSFLTHIARDTRTAIASVYPREFLQVVRSDAERRPARDHAALVKKYEGKPGVLLSFDADTLVGWATRYDGAIEVLPQVGDFLACGEDLFVLRGPGRQALADCKLSDCIALGTERTLEQDPAFGIRIIVDVANKALSPAINDPTTAVLAIDQLHYLLHFLAGRQIGHGALRDAAGRVRLTYRAPEWEDFLTLAVVEIRTYGASSAQVTRRLKAMFEHLLRSVPAERAAAILGQQALLDRAVQRAFSDREELELARQADLQGLGGRRPDTSPPA